MAKIEFKGIEKYQKILAEIGNKSEKICKVAVYDGAAIVADAVRKNYDSYSHPYSEGNGLIDSMGLSKMQNDSGYVNTKLGFFGYLKDGKPAALVAAAMESGTSHQSKKPFVRTAVKRVKASAQNAMKKTLDEQIERIMKKGE